MTTSPPPHSPYAWAAAILATPARAERARLLEACPPEWQALVREAVETHFAKVQVYRQYLERRQQGEQQPLQPAPRREDTSFRISDFTKAVPEVGNAHLSQIRGLLGQQDATHV